MALTRLLPKPNVLILLAPRFEEVGALLCTSELRGRGFNVALLGLGAGPVESACGITLWPDATLAEWETLLSETPQLLVLAGGTSSAALALADPRTHRLIGQVLAGGGHVAALLESERLFHESGLWDERLSERLVWQLRQPLTDFVRSLGNLPGR